MHNKKNQSDKLAVIAVTKSGRRKVVQISNNNLPIDIVIGILIISILGIIILGW